MTDPIEYPCLIRELRNRIMDNDYIGSPKEFYTSQIYFNHRRKKEITDILHSYISDEYRRS